MMRLAKAPVGLGFDASTYIAPPALAQLKAAGYQYRLGYLNRQQRVNDNPDTTWPISMSRRELTEHLEADFLVGLIQFARFDGKNYLSTASGHQYGYTAAWNARALGAPKGAHLWLDAEWVDGPGVRAVLDYCNAWCKIVCEEGYRAAVYEGWEDLTGDQWYSIPHATSYMRSAMKKISSPQPRGFALYQGWEHSKANADRGRPPIFGQAIDPGFACYDDNGDRPWMIAA